MDLDRVGVMGFGSMPKALAGMLVHPEFYRVGVSVCAMGDSRLAGAQGMSPVGE